MPARMPAATKEAPHLSILEIQKKIDKKYGPGSIVKASELVIPRTITTGSLAFDIMYGGGLAVGKHHEVVGEFSHGKTVFLLQTLAANQALNPELEAVWFAAEPFNKEWAAKNGVDVDRLWLFESNVMEEVYDTQRMIMQNRAADLIILDSLPALVPTEEDQKDMDAAVMAVSARMNNRFFNRVSNHAMKRSMTDPDDRPITSLVVNQWREKIGVMYGDNRTTPGGKGKDFAFWTRTEVRRSEWLKHGKRTVGIEIAAKTHKNKSAPVRQGAKVDFYFADAPGHPAGRYDFAKDLFVTAVYLGVITSGGYPKFRGERIAATKEEAQRSIREDLDLQRAIYADTMLVASKGGTDLGEYDPDQEEEES